MTATAEPPPDTQPKVKPSKVADPEQYRMSIGEHLEELRTRLVRALIGFVVVFLVCFYFSKPLTAWFCRPLYQTLETRGINPQLYTTEMGEGFMVTVRVSLVAATAISAPWILYQFWMFVATGLYPSERKYITRYIPLSVFLLIGGMVFAYLVVLPWTIQFFMDWMIDIPIPEMPTARIPDDQLPPNRFIIPSYAGDPLYPSEGQIWFNTVQKRIKIFLGGKISVLQFLSNNLLSPHIGLDNYIDSVFMMLLVFGLSFQLPLVVMALTRVGIVTKPTLKAKRKIVYFILFIVAAAITPGDAITATVGLSIPLAFLYELGIWLSPNPPPEDAPAA